MNSENNNIASFFLIFCEYEEKTKLSILIRKIKDHS